MRQLAIATAWHQRKGTGDGQQVAAGNELRRNVHVGTGHGIPRNRAHLVSS